MKKVLILILLAASSQISCMKRDISGNSYGVKTVSKKKTPHVHNLANSSIDSLALAVTVNNTEAIEEQLNKNVHINGQNSQGLTPLIVATQVGSHSQDMILFLIEKGADISATDYLGRTPLMHAVMPNDKELVEFILLLLDFNKKAINIADSQNKTALNIALDNGFDDLAHLLVENGASLAVIQPKGSSNTKIVENLADILNDSKIEEEPKDIDMEDVVVAERIEPQIIWQVSQKLNYKFYDLDGSSLKFLSACEFVQNFANVDIEQLNIPIEIKEILLKVKQAYQIAKVIKDNKQLSTLFHEGTVSSNDMIFLKDLLAKAIETSDLLSVKVFLTSGVSPNIKVGPYPGQPAITYAALSGNLELVGLLLQYDVQDLCKLFNRLAMSNDIEMLNLFIKSNKVNKEDIDKALVLAANKASVKAVEFLLENGASCSSCDTYGNTALAIAVKNNSKELVKLLLKYNTNANDVVYSIHGAFKPLIMLAQDTEMAQLLIDRGALVDAKDSQGNNVLHYKSNAALVEMFIKLGADVNAKNDEGDAPIHVAYPYTQALNILIANGADINATDNGGQTALIKAARDSSSVSSIEALLLAGANIDVRDNKGRTALMYAVEMDISETVALLLKYRADIKIKDSNGRTAFDIARSANKDNIRMMLKNAKDRLG